MFGMNVYIEWDKWTKNPDFSCNVWWYTAPSDHHCHSSCHEDFLFVCASDMFQSYMYGNAKYMFSARTRRQLKYRYGKMVNTGKNCLSYGHKCLAETRCVTMKGNKILGRFSVSLSIPPQCLAENACESRQLSRSSRWQDKATPWRKHWS